MTQKIFPGSSTNTYVNCSISISEKVKFKALPLNIENIIFDVRSLIFSFLPLGYIFRTLREAGYRLWTLIAFSQINHAFRREFFLKFFERVIQEKNILMTPFFCLRTLQRYFAFLESCQCKSFKPLYQEAFNILSKSPHILIESSLTYLQLSPSPYRDLNKFSHVKKLTFKITKPCYSQPYVENHLKIQFKESLEELTIESKTALRDLKPFDPFRWLYSLDLKFLDEIPNLLHLSVKGYQITELNKQTLTSVHLNYCIIYPEVTEALLHSKTLKTLDVAHSVLQLFSERSYDNNSIEHLTLSESMVEEILESDIQENARRIFKLFGKLTSLKTLNIVGCNHQNGKLITLSKVREYFTPSVTITYSEKKQKKEIKDIKGCKN